MKKGIVGILMILSVSGFVFAPAIMAADDPATITTSARWTDGGLVIDEVRTTTKGPYPAPPELQKLIEAKAAQKLVEGKIEYWPFTTKTKTILSFSLPMIRVTSTIEQAKAFYRDGRIIAEPTAPIEKEGKTDRWFFTIAMVILPFSAIVFISLINKLMSNADNAIKRLLASYAFAVALIGISALLGFFYGKNVGGTFGLGVGVVGGIIISARGIAVKGGGDVHFITAVFGMVGFGLMGLVAGFASDQSCSAFMSPLSIISYTVFIAASCAAAYGFAEALAWLRRKRSRA